jgi:hypothetical protein
MNIKKEVLGELERAYATCIMEVNGELTYIVASEGHTSCMAYNAVTKESTVVWDGPGGTMNIIPIPNRKNEFVATQKFFPTFNSKESMIVHGKCDNEGNWTIKPIMQIPYLHRFDLFLIEDELYFIGGILCDDKDYKDDWSKPGRAVIGKMSDTITEEFELTTILDGLTKHHGFCAGQWKGKKAFFLTAVEGAYVAYIPERKNGEWQIEQLLSTEVSDMAICDIDCDGELEIATIEPFHGEHGKIYKNIDGEFKVISEHEYEFGHVVWGGILAGQKSFIIGGRKGKQEVICYQYDQKTDSITKTLIDNVGGPSNISVINLEDKDIILAANRQIGQVAIYEITK